jgi:hypothetical protein
MSTLLDSLNLLKKEKIMFKKIAAAGSLATLAMGQAFAAVPADVQTALTEGKTDAAAVAGLALVIVVGIAVFKYMRKGV